VYYYFDFVCLQSFHQGSVLYTADGTVVEESSGEQGIVEVNFGWNVGSGQMCFRAGFVVKAVDLVCNCIIATPTITRDRNEQWEYERQSEQAEVNDGSARGRRKESIDNEDQKGSESSESS
jgi:hypothetical protein